MSYYDNPDYQKRHYEQQKQKEAYIREMAWQVHQTARQHLRFTVEPEVPRKILLLLPKRGT